MLLPHGTGDRPEARQALAVSLFSLSQLALEAGDQARAEPLLEESLELRKGLVGAYPDSAELRAQLALTLEAAAELLLKRDQAHFARKYLEEAVEASCEAVRRAPGQPGLRRRWHDQTLALSRLLLSLGDVTAAARVAQQLVEIQADPAARAEAAPRVAEMLGQCLTLAMKVKAADFDQEQTARRAVELLREAAARGTLDIERIKTSPELAALRQRGDFREVLAGLEKAQAP